MRSIYSFKTFVFNDFRLNKLKLTVPLKLIKFVLYTFLSVFQGQFVREYDDFSLTI
jgi:hypothetical protein